MWDVPNFPRGFIYLFANYWQEQLQGFWAKLEARIALADFTPRQ
jgi:hypothetical protein